ncbi:glycosyltransferase [Sulfurimonas sp. HSL-1716]|uniref:glycosyltransferase n=1 Tax=Hydrocurvibacter sulfurireducens TaxID=3131937 RepID=UPI0031F9E1C6
MKLLGAKNVVDVAWNKKFHINYKKYPKNLGYIPGSLFPSLINRVNARYDAVIVAASKVDCFEKYIELAPNIDKNIPVIFVDGGDGSGIGSDLTVYGRPELYEKSQKIRAFDYIFKREYLIGADHPANVFPLQISFNLDRLPSLPDEKKYDVSFWAVETGDGIRTRALNLLEDKFDCKANGTKRNQKFSRYSRKGSFYLQELKRCKIVLNFRGGGWDTMRYWEVPAVGSLMITQKPQINIPHDFENGVHVVHCKDDLSDLVELCEYYLKNESERETMAQAGKKHLEMYHTDVKRAEYILQKAHLV